MVTATPNENLKQKDQGYTRVNANRSENQDKSFVDKAKDASSTMGQQTVNTTLKKGDKTSFDKTKERFDNRNDNEPVTGQKEKAKDITLDALDNKTSKKPGKDAKDKISDSAQGAFEMATSNKAKGKETKDTAKAAKSSPETYSSQTPPEMSKKKGANLTSDDKGNAAVKGDTGKKDMAKDLDTDSDSETSHKPSEKAKDTAQSTMETVKDAAQSTLETAKGMAQTIFDKLASFVGMDTGSVGTKRYKDAQSAKETLTSRGYTEKFIIQNGKLYSPSLDRSFSTGNIKLIEMHSFEGKSKSDNMGAIFVFEVKEGDAQKEYKGVLEESIGDNSHELDKFLGTINTKTSTDSWSKAEGKK